MEDLGAIELVGVLPLIIGGFVLGLHPGPFLERLEPAVTALLKVAGS